MSSKPLMELLRSHVRSPFLTAFAYGSGVFKQVEIDNGNFNWKKGRMIDFLVVVNDNNLRQFHLENMTNNKGDYPFLGRLALKQTNFFNESVFYVPDVRLSNDKSIKYGVVGLETLIKDLYNWNSMFLAGRLQKPTLRDKVEDESLNKFLLSAMEFNYDSALNVALLLSKSIQDFPEILKKIISISYTNDPRLIFAESPQKIENILRGQLEELEEIYLSRWQFHEYKNFIHDPLVRMRILSNLPLNLRKELYDLWMVACSPNLSLILTEAIGRIVRRSAWKQIILGSISTSPIKSFNYILSKVKKRFFR